SSLVAIYGQRLIVRPENLELFRKVINLPEIQEIMPEGVVILLGKVDKDNIQGARPVYFLYDTVELTGTHLKTADVRIGQGMDPKIANKPYVSLQFDNEGSRIFANVTGSHINEQLAIVLDNIVHSAPVINDKIRDGNAMITGIGDMDEAKDLAIVLNAGNLPAPVNIVEERTVGPTLGSDSIKAGFKAAIIGLILVMLFMIIYYKISGIIANIALIGNVLIILAVLTMLNASLTMPGIAGIILTIGMAVDANVLIFERIREELRAGKSVRTAIDNGYKRAVITIADANITTLITAVVLYQFGTGPIRGFAVTLSIGILASMFTAIVVTKAIFDGVITRKPRKSLSI
ncbi:MAG TPA: protein translocase subunit SecD, partial [Candidatus Cloacimonetes bacterium]|nr:protein translocase subunit SecD [Candidatus Cloacimonadota bacterium]